MCKVLYIGASESLPLIPWTEEEPGFYVSSLERELDREARAQFSLPYVYYAGSHELCGCGFFFDENREQGVHVKSLDTIRSLVNLTHYIEDALAQGIAVQLFACEDGDQQVTPEHLDSVTPSQISAANFCFKEKQFLEVVRDLQTV